MNRFNKIVVIEPISLIPSAEKELCEYALEVVLYPDIPSTAEEIVRRIGDADAVLLSYTSTLTADIMAQCPHIRYVGMCCSLYSPESANVDIRYAEAHGITVTGIRDYGDEGVVEYVVSELVRLLHGFGEPSWESMPREITGLKVGVVGLGKSGGMIADALHLVPISPISPAARRLPLLPRVIATCRWVNSWSGATSFSVALIRIRYCSTKKRWLV